MSEELQARLSLSPSLEEAIRDFLSEGGTGTILLNCKDGKVLAVDITKRLRPE